MGGGAWDRESEGQGELWRERERECGRALERKRGRESVGERVCCLLLAISKAKDGPDM